MAQPVLSFLRPLRLPRPSTIRHFLSYSTTTARRQEAAPFAIPLVKPPPPRSNSRTTSPKSSEPLNSSTLILANPASGTPYHVQRTPSGFLPVYQLAKRGGNLHQTRIRKISGDVDALRLDIIALLGIDPNLVTINRVTGHVVMKGWYRGKVSQFLTEKKF